PSSGQSASSGLLYVDFPTASAAPCVFALPCSSTQAPSKSRQVALHLSIPHRFNVNCSYNHLQTKHSPSTTTTPRRTTTRPTLRSITK
ncbi:hypothetical protein BDP81DRAFT_371015, partial [Colletotrichum phormii]